MKKSQNSPVRTGESVSRSHSFLKTAARIGMLGLATAMAANTVASRRIWPNTPLQVGGGSEESRRVMMTFGGLGSIDGRTQAEHIAPLFPALPSAYVEYASTGFSVPDIAAVIRRRFPKIERAGLQGHSMGGPSGLEALRQAGIRQLGPIVLHCSPFDGRDARSHKATKAVEVIRVPVGPAGKGAFSLVRGLLERKSLPELVSQVRTDASSGCSPRLWMDQIRALRRLRLEQHLDEYADMAGDYTEAWYCMPEDPVADMVVNTVQASQRYGEFFTTIGVPYHIVKVPSVGHAEVAPHCAYLATHAALVAHAELTA